MIRDKFLKLQGWMVEQLGLTANELIIYSIIYSYVMKDVAKMEAQIPTQAFMEWTGLGKRQILRICDELQERGLLKIRKEAGKPSSYSIDYELVESAKNGKLTLTNKASGCVKNVTSDKMSPVTSMSKSGDIHDTGVVTSMSKSGDIMSPVNSLQHTTKNTTYNSACACDINNNTKVYIQRPHTAPTAINRSSSSTDKDTEKTRIQLEALKAMSTEGYDTSKHDVVKEFNEAYDTIDTSGKKPLTELEKSLIKKSFDWLHL